MFISTAQNNVNFKRVEVQNFNSLIQVICSTDIKAYSLSVYKNDYRNKVNFESMRFIGLDIDNDKSDKIFTIEDAKVAFKNYKCIIATTRNHQKEKNGLTVDRFRVILVFKDVITDANEFSRAWYDLKKRYPAIDPACKDESRYWFPSNEVVYVKKKGKYVDIPDEVETVEPEIVDVKPVVDDGTTGKLSYNTMKFFCQGADAGERNNALFKAVVDCREQGYDLDYVKTMITNMINISGNWGTDYLNGKDIETIENAFNRDVKYDKRIDEDEKENSEIPFNFVHIKETIHDETIKTDWLVENFLTVGGISLVAGQPKSGKSTIVRQMAIAIAQGKTFLDRDVKQSKVFYLALEDQTSQVKDQFIAQKVKDDDQIYVHYGPCTNNAETLKNTILQNEVGLLIVDTMALFLDVDDLNNYDIINKMLKDLRQVARETGCHISMVHHQNKNKDGGTLSIMGSNAIHGAIDNAIIFENVGKNRFISSSQRGGVRFSDTKLSFNLDNQTYKLAKKNKETKYDENDDF